MKTIRTLKGLLAVIGSALVGLTIATIAAAANPETVPVQVTFAAPITVTKISDLRFGLLDIAMASTETVTINPDDTFSDPQSNVVGGTQGAAQLTVTATVGQPITITADTFAGATYYTLDTFMCNYNTAGSDTDCSSGYSETSAASATLKVGAKLTKNATPALAGADNSTFLVTVAYQ